jgi:hypothetical protein
MIGADQFEYEAVALLEHDGVIPPLARPRSPDRGWSCPPTAPRPARPGPPFSRWRRLPRLGPGPPRVAPPRVALRGVCVPFAALGPSLPTEGANTKEARGTKNGRKRDRAEAGHGAPTTDGDRKGDRRTGGGELESQGARRGRLA